MTGGVDPLSPAGRAARLRHVELQAALWGPDWHDVYDDDGEHLGRAPVTRIVDDGYALAVERVEQLVGVALSTRPGGIGAALAGGYRGDTGESALYALLRLAYAEDDDILTVALDDGDTPLMSIPGPTLRVGLVERRAEP